MIMRPRAAAVDRFGAGRSDIAGISAFGLRKMRA
jgi:hypothetical protein